MQSKWIAAAATVLAFAASSASAQQGAEARHRRAGTMDPAGITDRDGTTGRGE
jgi:hypothetical protein